LLVAMVSVMSWASIAANGHSISVVAVDCSEVAALAVVKRRLGMPPAHFVIL
jgi:hypothetical protein